MKIKWYALAEWLGLMEDLSAGNGSTLYTVSAKADDFFETAFFSLIPLLFLTGFLLNFLLCHRRRLSRAVTLTRWGVGVLLVYAVLLAIGVGPYIQFYPHSVGFVDFSVLEHALSGLYCAFLALLFFWGGRLGRRLGRHPDN